MQLFALFISFIKQLVSNLCEMVDGLQIYHSIQFYIFCWEAHRIWENVKHWFNEARFRDLLSWYNFEPLVNEWFDFAILAQNNIEKWQNLIQVKLWFNLACVHTCIERHHRIQLIWHLMAELVLFGLNALKGLARRGTKRRIQQEHLI